MIVIAHFIAISLYIAAAALAALPFARRVRAPVGAVISVLATGAAIHSIGLAELTLQTGSASLASALRKLGDLSPQQSEALDHFSRALMNKFLHEPSVRLRAAAANGRGLGVVDAARYLFGLEPERDEPGSKTKSGETE